MKLIEALKKQKDLVRKKDDIVMKIAEFSSDMEDENPIYGNENEYTAQKVQTHKQHIASLVQAVTDINKEILSLRIGIQKTNLNTGVAMEINGKTITHTIAEWIHRKRDLISFDTQAYIALAIKEKKLSPKQIIIEKDGVKTPQLVNIRRYYDVKARDTVLENLTTESSIIDSKLEIVNATTELCL